MRCMPLCILEAGEVVLEVVLEVVMKVLEVVIYTVEVVNGVRCAPWVLGSCSVFWRPPRASSVCWRR